MAKPLRKMFGDINAPETLELMRLIDTQSKNTICNWCIDYAEANILPIFEKHCPSDNRPKNALNAARDYLKGDVKFTVVKDIILNQCHAAARELNNNPAAQAAVRACGQASAVVHTQSHSLGLYFYGSAALAYDKLGTNAALEEYNVFAKRVCAEITEALRSVAVDNEENPVKIKWYC